MPNGDPMNASPTQSGPRSADALQQPADPMSVSGAAGSPVLDVTFKADGLFRLRSAVAAYADELGAGSEGGDVVLVAHELCSNAVKHGGGSGRLRLWRDDRGIRCRGSDSGAGMTDPASRGFERPSPQIPGGRGLWIVRRLADVHISTGPTGTTITVTMATTGGS